MEPVPISAAQTSPEDDSRFLVHSRMEIAAILRGAMQGSEMVSAYFSAGRESMVTALLAVDHQNGFCLVDAAKDEQQNERFVASDRITFVSRQDRVKIRWEVAGARLVQYEGHPALLIPLPDHLLKFQRREFYRVETPVIRPVKCVIPRDDGRLFEVNLFDIGLGGVGLLGFPDDFSLEAGRTLEECTITLPEAGVLSVTLQVRNICDIALPDGRTNRRAGCRFVGLHPASEKMIQRYIMRLERERRARIA
ncbi:MAG: hypothetical protein GC151_01315 [Betaproteobacteria bacterium]|nr:hypothetical protein [Betaproteobacteria bacterium]